MPGDALDEVGAPPLCTHHAAVINNARHLDHIDDRASNTAAHHIARQCPQCRKDQP